MWAWLYQLASPAYFYQWSAHLQRYLARVACVLLGIGLFWGLFIAPADYQQGDAYRIMYIHVPSAFLSLFLYSWMGFLALLLLIWRIKMAGLMLINAARVGALMTLLALISGSIWGKPMWGAFWVWDARLTSELILLVMYCAIIAVHHAMTQTADADRLAAILTLIGLLDLPVIHYSVYWWNTLHQGATLTILSKPKLDASMLWPLLFCLAGFLCLCFWMVLSRASTELLWRERRQRWVKCELEKNLC